MTADRVTLLRSGDRPLVFDGELLAEADTFDRTRDLDRWLRLAVYRTAGGRYVVACALHQEHRGTPDVLFATHADEGAAIAAIARDFDAAEHVRGFPVGVKGKEARAARLVDDLRRRWGSLVTHVFEQLGPDFAEVVE